MKIHRVSTNQFKELMREDPLREDLLLSKSCGAEFTKSDDSGLLTFTLSDNSVDREDDVINVSGWDLKNYKKNGPMLWAHDPRLPPIAAAKKVWKDSNKLKGSFEFTPKDFTHPLGDGFGDTVRRMYEGGFLNAVSVGFRAKEWRFNEDRSGHAVDYMKQELLETSAVPIPANPNALYDASQKGLDILPIYRWCEKELDEGNCIIVDRDTIEGAYKLLKPQFNTLKGTKVEIDPDSSFKKVMSKLFGSNDKKEKSKMEKIDELGAKVDALAETLKSFVNEQKEIRKAAEEKAEAEEKATLEAKEKAQETEKLASVVVEQVKSEVTNMVKSRFNAVTGKID